ncbi:Phosphate ABC transporter periplasmic phosphate-binding domain containing protein [Halorhabdus tiamatea SARL4B]|uniref:Phosphate ABC transporter periplasmic phosphate-binding domain containing protein n=1 Tax=Halorhabdus tiamatea SARL4B TaxID=1033806 RepID=F7PM96_9EURY|nr:phosphate ABC transporter substrate-binding protein PstS family protein [Halorhabdus tiamatea]ERJ05499.1 Phosphate ABC transporter periplasmic phosphate-binding domain containing protein [Halorhabdus tiamatea SARL4B]CCQ32910.1 phosphate ABC transporter, periplasmic phosphate-binding protein PstS (TC 3.A.1.7.1) [Halorhabdus tiamatea SARL4B]
MARKTVRDVSRRDFLLGAGAVGTAAVSGCVENVRSNPGGGDDGQVIVKGSSTVYLISDRIAQQFMGVDDENATADSTVATENNVNVTVDSTGTGGGFKNHFCPGASDINGASRPITDEELASCRDNDVEPVEFQVGRDALTVIVNNDADWVDCLTYEELSLIWRDEGGAKQWSDIRDEWPDEPIKLFGPASTSGTYDWFHGNVIGEEYDHTTDHEPNEKDNIIIRGVAGDQYAMGYLGFAYYTENSDRVKAVPVDGGSGGGCVPPTIENATDGSYPMTRPLFIYVNRQSLTRDPVFDFTSFYLEQAGTDLVSEVGYVPIDEETRDDNLAKLLLETP